MTTITPSLTFFLNLAIVQSAMSRRFDGKLGSLGLTEFLILFQLENAPEGKMRRVDLAEHVGLTASGVTRLLAPMEKIGLIKREANAQDARVSYVSLAAGGKRMLKESMENAEELAQRLLSVAQKKEIEGASKLLVQLGGSVR
jgi:DNA-binding MarR family transcriptional regulator